MVDWTERRVVGQEAMDLADGAAAEMLVMIDDEHIDEEAVEWCKTGVELFVFEGGHLNGGKLAGCLVGFDLVSLVRSRSIK